MKYIKKMKKYDPLNRHYGSCVSISKAIEKQKEILSAMEARLDDEITRQDKLASEREVAIKEIEKAKPEKKKSKK